MTGGTYLWLYVLGWIYFMDNEIRKLDIRL